MRKTLVLALIIAAVLLVSAAAVFSHPVWRDVDTQGQSKVEKVTLEGTIADTGRPTAALKVGDEEYILHLGPLWHQERDEYPFKVGQAVKVTGVVEDIYGKLHIHPFTIESEGKSITLFDEDNAPIWGGCYGHGPGHGWHDEYDYGHHMMNGYGRHMMGGYGHMW